MKHIVVHKQLNYYAKVCHLIYDILQYRCFSLVAIEDVYNNVVEHYQLILFE